MADCPFFAGSTITDPRFFVGRREALKLLSDRMQGSQPTSINVVGRHKTGKSSLLVHFQQTYGQRVTNPDGYRVAYLSLQNSACETEEKFYREIAKELGQGEQTLDRQGFTAWVKGLKDLGILPVLCVDNFEELLEQREQFPNGFYDNLRFLIDSNCLMMVMASREMLDVYSRQKQITSDFFNVFQTIDLNGGLTETEATELVQKKNMAGERLTADVQEIALKWGKLEPFLLQLAGRTLWEMQRYNKSQKWAQVEFKKQANRFKFQPKSKFLGVLFLVAAKVGKTSLRFIENKDEIKEFWVGLFVICITLAIVILAVLGVVGAEQIQSIFEAVSGD